MIGKQKEDEEEKVKVPFDSAQERTIDTIKKTDEIVEEIPSN
jgi:hypothetical protein